MDLEDYHFKFKIVLLGDKGVGKSAFLDCLFLFNKKIIFTKDF